MNTWYIEKSTLRDRGQPDFSIPYTDEMNLMSSDEIQTLVKKEITMFNGRKKMQQLLDDPNVKAIIEELKDDRKRYTKADMTVALGAVYMSCKLNLPLDDKEWIDNYNKINNIG